VDRGSDVIRTSAQIVTTSGASAIYAPYDLWFNDNNYPAEHRKTRHAGDYLVFKIATIDVSGTANQARGDGEICGSGVEWTATAKFSNGKWHLTDFTKVRLRVTARGKTMHYQRDFLLWFDGKKRYFEFEPIDASEPSFSPFSASVSA
jgi:hypothetical protein